MTHYANRWALFRQKATKVKNGLIIGNFLSFNFFNLIYFYFKGIQANKALIMKWLV